MKSYLCQAGWYMMILDTKLTIFMIVLKTVRNSSCEIEAGAWKHCRRTWLFSSGVIVLWETTNLCNTPLVAEPLSCTAVMYHS